MKIRIVFRTVYAALFVLIVGCVGSSKNIKSELSQENGKSFFLSSKEKNWLASHPNIKLAPDPDFIPIEYFDENGNYKSIAADYIALVEKKLGIKLKIVQLKNWQEIIARTKTGEVDIWGAARATP